MYAHETHREKLGPKKELGPSLQGGVITPHLKYPPGIITASKDRARQHWFNTGLMKPSSKTGQVGMTDGDGGSRPAAEAVVLQQGAD